MFCRRRRLVTRWTIAVTLLGNVLTLGRIRNFKRSRCIQIYSSAPIEKRKVHGTVSSIVHIKKISTDRDDSLVVRLHKQNFTAEVLRKVITHSNQSHKIMKKVVRVSYS